MATVDEVPRFVVNFQPTLSHMSLVKLAVRLYYEFGLETLKKALSDIESGIQAEDLSSKDCPPLSSRAKESLLLVPTTLRKKVLGVVECVANEDRLWRFHHRHIPLFDHAKYRPFWRCDGSIDRTKTAQEICRNQNVHIAARFEIACRYFLVDELKSFWAVLNTKRDKENFRAPLSSSINNVSVQFWIERLKKKTQIPWTQAVQEFSEGQLARMIQYNSSPISFFREIKPKTRWLCCYDWCIPIDYDQRFCLYLMTNEEQEYVMKRWAFDVLMLHMNWPLTSLFLETAEKAWKFLDGYYYCRLLKQLLDRMHRTDFDFECLAEEFWKRSPEHFKEYARSKSFPKLNKFIAERTTESK